MSIVLSNPRYSPEQVSSGDKIKVFIDVATDGGSSLVRLRYSSVESDMTINGGTSLPGGTKSVNTTEKTSAKTMTVEGPTGDPHKLLIIGQEVDVDGNAIGNPTERSVRVVIV